MSNDSRHDWTDKEMATMSDWQVIYWVWTCFASSYSLCIIRPVCVSLCCVRAALLNSLKKLDTKGVLKPNSFLGPVMLWISCWSIQTSLWLPVGKFVFFLVPSSTGRSEVVFGYKQMSWGWKSFTALPVDTSDERTFVNKEAELSPLCLKISVAGGISVLVSNLFVECLTH